MTVNLDVPEDRLGSFQRLKRQLPLEIREDAEVLHKLLVYLKLGGDRLGRQFVATIKTEFPQDTQLFKRRAADDALEDGDGTDADSDQDAVAEDAEDNDARNGDL